MPEACAVVTKRPWKTIAQARADLVPGMLVTCGSFDYFKDKTNAYIVRYENLRQKPETHFAELLGFCGAKDYDIDRVLADSSFENMKKNRTQCVAGWREARRRCAAALLVGRTWAIHREMF